MRRNGSRFARRYAAPRVVSSAPSVTDVDSLPNLFAQFRADVSVTPGATMTWATRKGAAVTLSQATAGKQPGTSTDAGISGQAVLTFDGTADEMNVSGSAALPTARPFTVCFVTKCTEAGTNARYVFGQPRSSSADYVRLTGPTNATPSTIGFESGGGTTFAAGTPSDTSWHFWAVSVAGTGANQVEFFKDGVSLGTGTRGAGSSGTVTSFNIGSFGGGGYFVGSIADWWSYSDAKSASDISALRTGYVTPRYGI